MQRGDYNKSLFFHQKGKPSLFYFIVFIFFIWISYFQIHTTVALRRLTLLASCIPLKVRYEEIVKAMGKSLRRLKLMKKDDFIYNVEKWLVRNDVSDEEYIRSPSQI